MWGVVCGGLLAANICIDPIATMILLTLTAVVVTIADAPGEVRDGVASSVSARISTDLATSHPPQPTEPNSRMKTENSRRFVPPPVSDEPTAPRALSHGCNVQKRTSASHKRLMETLMREMEPRQFQTKKLDRDDNHGGH